MSTDDSPLPQRLPWFVVIVLFCLSCASFGERINISVAAEVMMPALLLNKAQIALVFNAFLIGYAIFQVPAGWLGDRLGARVVLGWSALAWAGLTALCGLLPGTFWTTVAGTITVLWLLRFFLGAAEASTYPVAAQAIHRWLPPASRGIANSIMLMGSSVAAAVTAPFVSWVLPRYGWRASFYLTAFVALAASLLWFRVTRRLPQTDQTTVLIEEDSAIEPGQRLNIILLAISYMSEGYLLFLFVSWLYIYLIEVRGFSLVQGGLVSSLPWIAAMCATPLGGFLSDRLTRRFGTMRSARVLIMTGYLISGTLLLAAAKAPGRGLAVLSLCISLGALYMAEPSFWIMATALGGRRGGTVAGFTNMVGIAGGILSNWLLPLLVARFGHRGWTLAFFTGTGMGVMCSALWWLLGRRLRNSTLGLKAKPAF